MWSKPKVASSLLSHEPLLTPAECILRLYAAHPGMRCTCTWCLHELVCNLTVHWKPTSRNSSPRFLWLGSIPFSQSCWWAPIFQYLSPTSPYRPWCLPLGWSTQYNRYKQINKLIDKCRGNNDGTVHVVTVHRSTEHHLGASYRVTHLQINVSKTASHQHQLAGLGSVVSRLLNAAAAGRTSPRQWCNLTRLRLSLAELRAEHSGGAGC